MVKQALIVGPSGIGQAHLRELIKIKTPKIYLLGKKYKKNRIKNINLKISRKSNLINLRDTKGLIEKKIDLTSICSPTNIHLNHIRKVKNFSKHIIVEKPLIWIKKKNLSNFKISKKILKKRNPKIFVNLPLISLASQLKQRNEFKKINNLTFNYFTKGKKKFDDIAIDLLPHANSFILELLGNKINNFKIIKIIKKKYSWKCQIIINDCFCKFNFKQNITKKKSSLSFKINNHSFLRKQTRIKDEYVEKLLINKKKLIDIDNPFTKYYQKILKNLKKVEFLKKNNTIALNSVKIAESLVKYTKLQK